MRRRANDGPSAPRYDSAMSITLSTAASIHWNEAADDANAPCVVLLHGLGGDAGFWSAEQQALRSRFRVLAIDLRGSGLTPGCAHGFSIDDLADDVVTVLDAAKVPSAHVVGFSMGGLVAQALAGRAPERVRKLVLAATFATTPLHSRRFLAAVGAVHRQGATTKQVFELVLPWLFSTRFLGSAEAAPFLDYPDDAPESPPEDWLKLVDAQLSFDGRPRLAAIRAPTLVIAGDEDRLAPPGDAEALALGIRGAVLERLPAGHLVNVECRSAFIRLLECFLQKTPIDA